MTKENAKFGVPAGCEANTKTLLQLAMAIRGDFRRPSAEEIELAIAFVESRIPGRAVAAVIGKSAAAGASGPNWALSTLRRAVASGEVRIVVVNEVHQ